MAELPEHLFLFPSGRACLLDRAIVYNSGFTWRMALPRLRADWKRLTPTTVRNIARLAHRLRALERRYSGRSGIVDPAFRVRNWWNPRQPCWASGRRLMLAMPGERSAAVIDKLDAAGLDDVRAAPSICDYWGDWVEILLTSTAVRP